MDVSQNEQKEDKGNVNILAKEIESWKEFEYALREENATLFKRMLSECQGNEDMQELLALRMNTSQLNPCLWC